MSSKKNMYASVTLMLLVTFFLVFSATAQGKPIIMTVAHDDKPGGIEDRAMVKFAEVVERLTDGAIKGKVHSNRELGDEKGILEGIKMGTIHASNITTDQMSNWVPSMAICGLPYAFRSQEHVQRCMNGTIGDFLAKKAEDAGLTVVGYYYHSARDISAKRQIRTLEDLKGLKLRVMPVPTHLKGYGALGINVTPMSYSEVYMGLKTGVIDAIDVPLIFWWEQKFWEVVNHFNFTGVFYSTTAVVVGQKWFNSLTPKQQAVIRIAARESSDYLNVQMAEGIRRYTEKGKAKGIQFHKVNIDPFAKKRPPILRPLISISFGQHTSGFSSGLS